MSQCILTWGPNNSSSSVAQRRPKVGHLTAVLALQAPHGAQHSTVTQAPSHRVLPSGGRTRLPSPQGLLISSGTCWETSTHSRKPHSENVPRRHVLCLPPQPAPDPDLSSLLFWGKLAQSLPSPPPRIPNGISSQDADELWAAGCFC